MDYLDTLHEAKSAASNALKIIYDLLLTPPIFLSSADVAVLKHVANAANAIEALDTKVIFLLGNVPGPNERSDAEAALAALNAALAALSDTEAAVGTLVDALSVATNALNDFLDS